MSKKRYLVALLMSLALMFTIFAGCSQKAEDELTIGYTIYEPMNYMGDDGKFHIGKPMKARPYLKPAVANHVGTYKNIIKDELSK